MFLLLIESSHQEYSATVCSTRAKAVKLLVEYTKQHWYEIIDEDWGGMSGADLIAQYFDPDQDYEAYEIKELTLNAPLDYFQRF